MRLADQNTNEALENNARLAELLETLPNKSREQKMKDAMSAMANLHEVLPFPTHTSATPWCLAPVLPLLVCSCALPPSSPSADLLKWRCLSARNQVNRYNAEIHLKGAVEGAGARRS